MDSVSGTRPLNMDGWNIKAVERKRGRMKFQFKLSKEESAGFKEFSTQLKPEGMNDADWLRAIFYKGLEKIQEDLMEGMKQYMEEHKDELEASALQMANEDVSSAPYVSSAPEIIE